MRVNEFDCVLMEIGVLVKYKLPPYVNLIYESIVKHISIRGKVMKFLNLPIEADSEFLVRGLILDYVHGNVLRIGADGHIVAASHGSVPLKEADICRIYPGKRWVVVDQYFGNVLSFLKGHVSNKLMVLLNYFEIAIGLAFIRIVDTIDIITPLKLTTYSFAFNAIKSAVLKVLDESDGYFATLIENPDHFIYKCEDVTVNWLTSLRQSNKHLILFSEWSFDFTTNVLKFVLGPQWNTVFNFIMCRHNKISFFMKTNKFKRLPTDGDSKQITKFYTKGSWSYYIKYIQQTMKKTQPKVLSFGTDFILDTYLQKLYVEATHVLICEELIAELADGLQYDAPFDRILTSEMWGPYFTTKNTEMLWGLLIRRYSKCVAGEIEDIAVYTLEEDVPIISYEEGQR